MLRKLFAKRPPPTVRIEPDGAQFEVGRNQTILECALATGLAYPHDCTVGTCGRCRSRLVSGKVDAITPFGYTLSKEELDAGYILACQAVPEGDVTVEVELGALSEPVTKTTARITATSNLTHDIKAVTWQCDAPIAYKAGQYMNISWAGSPGVRSYSFARAPVSGALAVTSIIRRVPGGAFTERLFTEDLSEVAFTVEGPHGDFWLRDGTGPILMVGGGSGLAPLLAILEAAVEAGVGRDVILLFGARTDADLYCADDLDRIAKAWKGTFEYRPVLSEIEVSGIRHGLVTGEIGPAIETLGGIAGLQAYMCGPPGMIDAGISCLSTLRVPLKDIHYDKFTDASSGSA